MVAVNSILYLTETGVRAYVFWDFGFILFAAEIRVDCQL